MDRAMETWTKTYWDPSIPVGRNTWIPVYLIDFSGSSPHSSAMLNQFTGLLGIGVTIAIAYVFSRDRKAIRWKSVVLGILLQAGFAIAILGIPALQVPGFFRFVFDTLNFLMTSLVDFINSGSRFVFGPLAEIKDPWG